MLKAIGLSLGYLFFAALFLIGTIYLGVPAAQSLIFAAKLDSFPTAEGVMIDHKIKIERDQRNLDEHGPVEIRISHTPWLVYSFSTPDGKAYQAEEMLTAELSGQVKTSEAQAIAFANRFPKGHKVTVYYNPANPFEAALTTSKTKRFWLFQVGYLSAAFVALAMVGWFLWKGVKSLVGGVRSMAGSARPRSRLHPD